MIALPATTLPLQHAATLAEYHTAMGRRIGEFAGQPYSVTGELLSTAQYEGHLREMLPQPEDVKLVNEIQVNEPKWIAPKGSME